MLTCRECGLENHAGTVTCPNCGVNYPVGSTILVNILQTQGDKIELPPSQGRKSFSLLIRSLDGLQYLAIPERRHFILGRYDSDTQTAPDVDLTDFEAPYLGVSRFHAAIDRTSTAPMLTDLNSLNGTDLNGVRMQPYQPRHLCHNDIICLGKLILYVHL